MQLLDQALGAGASPVFFLARAIEHYDHDRFEAALEDVNLGLILAPQDPELLEYQYSALANLRRVDAASAALDVLAEVDPTNTNLGKWRDWVMRAQASSGAGSAWESYKRGRELLKAGDDAGALAAFRQAVQRDPAHFDSYQNIDYLLLKRREFDVVIQLWGAYLAQRPGDGRGYLERAGTNRHKGDMAAAQADIVKACELKNAQACGIAQSQGWQ
jgi:tetratricopeptide (TPR) repeat protein